MPATKRPIPTTSPNTPDDSTKVALLDAAQELAQTRGYNAFSFRDLSERVGIKTASIHYHFPVKGDLGRELVIRYRQTIAGATREIEARTADPVERLVRFTGMLRSGIKKGTRMCLCGVFSAEYGTLPENMQKEVRGFFDDCESWLASVLVAGRASKVLAFKGDPKAMARSLFCALQGAMLAACAFEDETRFTDAAAFLIDQLQA